MPASSALRLLPALVLALVGAALSFWLVPQEHRAVEEHLIGFPRSDPYTHRLRPIALGLLCFLPALAALVYAWSGTLDRYLARHALKSIGICSIALFFVWVLTDLNDNLDDYQKAESPVAFTLKYYGVVFPYLFVLLAPFCLLLGLLYSLGKLSASREIVAMIQSGRGVARVIAPLTCIGVFFSTACLLFNYHLAPWGDGYREALVDSVSHGAASQARNVLYHNPDDNRTWMVGSFPYNYNKKGAQLLDIHVTTKNDEGEIVSRFYAPIASWNIGTREWKFQSAEVLHMDTDNMPLFKTQESPLIIPDWKETPWQIVNPGLKAINLGVPGLHSWLEQNETSEWVDRRPFLTQWHHRFAQPWICLVVVLLGAPLGIVFTRRGTAGGVAVAVFLSSMMLFCTDIFLPLGDSGYMPPIAAAWGTNILFTMIALLLLWRRISGRPIYQSLKPLLPSGE